MVPCLVKFGIPAAILWFGYFLYDQYIKLAGEHFLFFMVTMIVCGTIGGLIGYKIHCRNQNNYQEIIDQIEDLTSGE